MHRYSLSLLLIILSLSFHSCTQHINNERDLVGTWVLNKISTPIGVSFELGDTEKSVQFRYKTIAEIRKTSADFGKNLSALDSSRTRENAMAEYNMIKQMHYTFTMDSVYKTFYYISETITIPGSYIFEKDKQQISCDFDYSKIHAQPVFPPVVFLIKDNQLIIKDEVLDKKEKYKQFSSTQEFVKKGDIKE